MKNETTIDPVMAEMHAIKDANAERFGGDLKAFFDYLQKLETKHAGSKKRSKSTPRSPRKARVKANKKSLAPSP